MYCLILLEVFRYHTLIGVAGELYKQQQPQVTSVPSLQGSTECCYATSLCCHTPRYASSAVQCNGKACNQHPACSCHVSGSRKHAWFTHTPNHMATVVHWQRSSSCMCIISVVGLHSRMNTLCRGEGAVAGFLYTPKQGSPVGGSPGKDPHAVQQHKHHRCLVISGGISDQQPA